MGSDSVLLITVMSIMIAVSLALPFVQESLNVAKNTNNVDGFTSEFGENAGDESIITSFTLLGSIFKMFFWTFSGLPTWLNTFFIILKITFYILLVRLIRGVGG